MQKKNYSSNLEKEKLSASIFCQKKEKEFCKKGSVKKCPSDIQRKDF